MMDSITLYDIKKAIRQYKTGGMVMPDDVKLDLADFQDELKKPDLSDEDRASFERAVSNILSKYPTEDQMDIIDMEDRSIEYLYNGNWFKLHPEKQLGEVKIDKNRWGKEIQVIKGNISDLNRIILDSDLTQLKKDLNIAVSSVNKPIEEAVTQPAKKEFVENIIEQSDKNIGKKAVRRKKKDEENYNSDVSTPVVNIRSYKQTFAEENPNISKEELRVYVWYKEQIDQRLSLEWYKLAFGEEQPYKTIDEAQIKNWVQNGYLFYSNGNLIPLPLYASGNIYEKVTRIVKAGENSGQDVEYILNKYGERALQEHLRVINEAFSKVSQDKLIISGNTDGNSLILKPTSKFARTFMIDHSESFPEAFKWWGTSKGVEGEKPKYDKTDGNTWRQSTFSTLSLTDAFSLWLTAFNRNIEIRSNLTYYDIIYYYIDKRSKNAPDGYTDAEKEKFKNDETRKKSNAQTEGDRLFLQFLNEELDLNQKVQIEMQWNAGFNNYLEVDYTKIPVAFNVTNNFFGEEPFKIEPEKREAVSFLFNEGTGCLAFDVGVGKSISAIFTIEQFIVAGYCKRPFIVIPNQTYKQWLSEIKNCMPHRKINGLYNLSQSYIEQMLDENNEIMKVEEGSISVMTYEGFSKLGFNDTTKSKLMTSLYDILNQGGADETFKKTDKERGTFLQKLETLVGKGLKGTNVEIESLGFDFVCYDEAHALKKVFTSVKGEVPEGKQKAKVSYDVQAGTPSSTALKGFMISNYILKMNKNRNVILLTATPFTNSPLEVFSMLALVAYHHLEKLQIVNINDFFDNYIDVKTELTINHKMTPQWKPVVKGFSNLVSLQKIIFRFFNRKEGDNKKRPNKYVIPYVKTLVNDTIVRLPEEEQVTSNIEMSDIQKAYYSDIYAYAEGKGELRYAGNEDEDDSEDEGNYIEFKGSKIYGDKETGYRVDGEVYESLKEAKDSLQESNTDEEDLSENDKRGVRALKSMNYGRNLALSPYLYQFNNLSKPTYQTYVQTSPKLQYVMDCIKTVKKYHEDHNEPISGQVIYMDRGIKYFNLLKDYLIYEVGFKPHEVGMITGQMTGDQKRLVQDAFLGQIYNPKTMDFESLDDSQRMKVLIGTGSIKEGMNLQKKSTVLYNCFLDWNPTDIIQLEGRIWRQKNQYANVRIVNPLMVDSIDTFMFQKLEEKTSRINTIWTKDGVSVLKLEEIDPEELKLALIRDPKAIAKFEVEKKTVTLKDQLNSINVLNKRLEDYVDNLRGLNRYDQYATDFLKQFAPKKAQLDIISKINYMIQLQKAEIKKDDEGRAMLNRYDKENVRFMEEFRKKNKGLEISPYDEPNTQYWLSSAVDYKRKVEKDNKDLLAPRNITPNSIDEFIDQNKFKVKDIQEQIKYLESNDYVVKRSEEIEKERIANKVKFKTLPELVSEFERLNYLLSIKKTNDQKPKKEFVYDKAVFFDENGVAKIDPKTIELLTEGVNSLPQTKKLYVDENDNYTEDRLLLHYEIINDIKDKITCVENDSPIAILTGGSPASGKSTFLRTYAPFLLSEELMKIDADEIRAKLPEYEGWNAAVTHLETKDIVNTLLTDTEIGVPCKFDLIYDGTMNSTKNYLPLIGTLHRLGYKVFIVYMDNVAYDVVKERMLKRYQSSGRFVPVEVIDDFFSKGKQALDELKSKVEGYMVVDASSKDYTIIEQGGMKLPTTRNYNQLGKPVKTGNLINKLIKGIKLLTNG